MKSRFTKRFIAMISVFTLVFCMFAIPTSATDETGWTAPTVKMDVDKNVVTAGAHRAAQIAPEILGLNNVATHQLGGSINAGDEGMIGVNTPTAVAPLEKAKKNALLGMFGSNANDNPNPYLWNYFYNSYAQANGKELSSDAIYLMVAMASPSAADVTPYDWPDGESIPVTLRRRPDILLGTGANKNVGYPEVIANMKENIDEDTTNDYNPKLIAYDLATAYTMSRTLLDMANATNQVIKENPSKTTRYGNPVAIAKQYEEYIKGISLYIMSEIEKGTVERKSVAVISSMPLEGTQWFRAYNYGSVDGTASSNRQAEYVHYTTKNAVDIFKNDATRLSIQKVTERGTERDVYCLSAEALMEVDYIIFAGQSGGTTEDAFKNTMESFGYDTSKLPSIFSSLPSCVYGITMNSVENAIGFGFFNGFVYPELINQSYAVAYFYENLFHISDQLALATAIDQNLRAGSLAEGITTDISAYTERDFEKKILQGLKYYNDNKAKLADTDLAPNTGETYGLTSIGAGIENSKTIVNVDTDSKKNVVAATVSETSQKTVEEAIVENFSKEEKELYNSGAEFDVNIEITLVDEEDIDEDVLKLIKDTVAIGEEIGAYLNIDIFYTLGNNDAVQVKDLGNDEIEITIELSKDLQGKQSYVIYREHEGKVTTIVPKLSADGKYLTFKSAKFSIYAIAYKNQIANTSDETIISVALCGLFMSAAGFILVSKKKELDY